MDTLGLARELIRKASVTPADAGCQALIAAQLGEAGFAIERLRFGEVDNLWARRGRASPALVFAGHTDVVPAGPREQWRVDPFAAEVLDGDLIGRGAADMKGSLAAMVNACRRFAARYPDARGALGMLITSDEEGAADDGTLKVMEVLAKRGETFQYCVVGEPSSAERLGDTVRVGRRGSLSGIMTIRGVQGHVAYALRAENPMHALARFVAAVTREPIDTGNEHFPPTTFQMVNVHCDAGAPNVVPGELKCRFNLRYSNIWTPEALSAREALRLATGGGAACLGRDDVGAITPGLRADIALFDVTGLAFAGARHDPVAALVFCSPQRVRDLLVEGRPVVRNGELVNVDERAVADEGHRVAARIATAAET